MKINEYITTGIAAKMLGVTNTTLRNWDKAGKLKSFRNPHSGYRLYKIEDINEFLKDLERSNK